MNAAVDSPLEALAFNLVNLGPLLTAAFNSLWAWLAVATAAFSFWRLRSSSVKRHDPAPEPETTISPSDYYSTIAKTTSSRSSSPEKKEEEGVLTRGNSMKERLFTVYYDQVEEERENGEDNEEGYEENNDVDGGDELVLAVKRWGPGKALTADMRGTGDLGWYCYQDRRVIDGSVVRLWGEERGSCGSCSCSPHSYRRRCSVGATPLVFPL